MLSIVIQLYILSEPKIKQCRTLIIHAALNMWHDPIDVSEIFLVHLTPFAEVGWLWLALVAVILGFPTWCHCRLRGLELGSRWCYGVLKNARLLHELKMLSFFVMHSKEAKTTQDLAALADLCWCSKDKTKYAHCGTGIQGKKLFAVRMEWKQTGRHWPQGCVF